MKYKEIFKLKKMLEDAQIPFDWIVGWEGIYEEEQADELKKIAPDLMDRYQICCPKGSFYDCDKRWISVIEGFGTYGNENDRLEIMGLLTPKEQEDDVVAGWLTAEEVFNRIKNYWEKGENKNE